MNALEGELPAALLDGRPSLSHLALDANAFAGALPGRWGGAARALRVLSLADNRLVGAAFPDGWQQPGAMPALASLDLSGNPGLNGSLPEGLAWPNLDTL